MASATAAGSVFSAAPDVILRDRNLNAAICSLINVEEETGRLIIVDTFNNDSSWIDHPADWDALFTQDDMSIDAIFREGGPHTIGFCVGIYVHEFGQSLKSGEFKGKGAAGGPSAHPTFQSQPLRVVVPLEPYTAVDKFFVTTGIYEGFDCWYTGSVEANILFFPRFRDDSQPSKKGRFAATLELIRVGRQEAFDDLRKAVGQANAPRFFSPCWKTSLAWGTQQSIPWRMYEHTSTFSKSAARPSRMPKINQPCRLIKNCGTPLLSAWLMNLGSSIWK